MRERRREGGWEIKLQLLVIVRVAKTSDCVYVCGVYMCLCVCARERERERERESSVFHTEGGVS